MGPSSIISKIKDKLSAPSASEAKKVVKGITFTDVKALHRPAPAWLWVLKLPPLPEEKQVSKGPKNPLLKAISKFLSAAPDTRIIMCEEIELPVNINIGTQDRYYNGRMTTFAGLPSLTNVKATFYESEDYLTTDYFRKWQNEIYNPETRVYGVPASYGKDIEFIALPSVDQEDLGVGKYMSIKFLKCAPMNIANLSYGNSTDRIKIQVEFSYLDMQVEILGGPKASSKTGAGELTNKLTQWRS